MSNFKPGDFVTIDGQDSVGEVVSLKGNTIEVAIGNMKVIVKASRLTLAKEEIGEEPARESSSASSLIDTKDKMLNFKFELDVRGKMKEEVLIELASWIDDAILLGVEEAKIIHGRGSGVLKTTIRSMLRKYKEVEKTMDEVKERGGDGSTIVRFKV